MIQPFSRKGVDMLRINANLTSPPFIISPNISYYSIPVQVYQHSLLRFSPLVQHKLTNVAQSMKRLCHGSSSVHTIKLRFQEASSTRNTFKQHKMQTDSQAVRLYFLWPYLHPPEVNLH